MKIPMKSAAAFLLLLGFLSDADGALHPSALQTEDLPDGDFGQAVKIKVDDSESIREVEVHFVGGLKPIDDKGNVFFSNSRHSVIGFNASPCTANQHVYLFRDSSGTVQTFLDCNSALAKMLRPK